MKGFGGSVYLLAKWTENMRVDVLLLLTLIDNISGEIQFYRRVVAERSSASDSSSGVARMWV